MKSAKFQIPNTKETQKSESQAAALDARKPPHNHRSVWSLKVGASVGFGAWHLGFLVAFLLATAASPNKQSDFHTDSGRRVKGGGGIQPDYEVYPEGVSRLRAALERPRSRRLDPRKDLLILTSRDVLAIMG